MLTENQAILIDSILEKRNESEGLSIDVWAACCSEAKYSSIPSAQKDFLKLKERGLIEFGDHFADPVVTDFGESIFLQNMILRVIGMGLPEGNEYSDVKISSKLSDFNKDFDPTEISYELDVLQERLFIDGEKYESQSSFHKRFMNVELITKGYTALNNPNRVWVDDSKEKSRFTTNIYANTINASSISTGSVETINSTLNNNQNIAEVLECIDALKQSSNFLPNEEDQKEAVEVLDQIKNGVMSQDITKVKIAYRAFCGLLSAASQNIPQVIDMTSKALDLWEKLQKNGINIPDFLNLS